MADSNSFFNLKEAMEKLWFHHNILFSQPIEIHTSLQSGSNEVSAHEEKIKKKPERLNIPINQPLYELQLPRRIKDKGSDLAERRIARMRKNNWSLSELENFEIEGFKDLGFDFNKEKLSPEMIRMVPGLRRLEGTDESLEDREVRRPYLSEVWLLDRSDSLLNFPRSHDSADMKKHLRSWAHNVASSIHEES
ncbi:uncharacterized protein LOC110107094 [Dendrobium catenatum]|uniref:Uncharacterized protein n=1 Tax=Dendrobium catenatum TaxID=906689 RepID=A0A2I0VUM2_9ASPA|nr:uncharacterized protein LOC110107094 [Dendrobium catenatum]PKU67122.1 hypothetical protein MA16_Dca012983 [Dendrobium catenatum]